MQKFKQFKVRASMTKSDVERRERTDEWTDGQTQKSDHWRGSKS